MIFYAIKFPFQRFFREGIVITGQYKIRILFSVCLIIAALAPAAAANLKKIEGEYVVAPKDGLRPIEFGLIVRGQAAKELYTHLPVKEKPDACTGGLLKSDPKGMHCIKDNNDYMCSLGYVLKTRAVTAGPLTC